MTTTRRQIRDLMYEPTKVILPDGQEIHGVVSDESESGCGVRLNEQAVVDIGMELRVLIFGGLRTARVRHVQPNLDGPIIGLEFATGSRIPTPQLLQQTNFPVASTSQMEIATIPDDLCIQSAACAEEGVQAGDLHIEFGLDGDVTLRQEEPGRKQRICLSRDQRLFVAEIVSRIVAAEELEVSEFFLGLPEHDGMGEPLLRVTSDQRISITQLDYASGTMNVIWIDVETVFEWAPLVRS